VCCLTRQMDVKNMHDCKWVDVKCLMFTVSAAWEIIVQCVPLATEPGISLIIVTPMKILQQNLNRHMFVV